MSSRLAAVEVAKRIRSEITLLDREARLASRDWAVAKTSGEYQDVYLNSTALHMHGFYNGLESLFRLIAIEVDGTLPEGPAWHIDLLSQVSGAGLYRPAVIRAEVAAELDVLRSFRHRIRNIYTANLDASLMEDMMANLPDLQEMLKQDLLAFAEHLGAD